MIDEEKLELYDRIQRRLTSMITGKDWDDEEIVNFLNEFKEFKYHPITVADYQKFKVWCKGEVAQAAQVEVAQAAQVEVAQAAQVDDKAKQIIDFMEKNPNKSNNWYATHNGVVSRRTYFNYLKEGKLDRLDR